MQNKPSFANEREKIKVNRFLVSFFLIENIIKWNNMIFERILQSQPKLKR